MMKKFLNLVFILGLFLMVPVALAAKYDVPIQYTDVATDGKSDTKPAVTDALLENACFAAQDEPFGGVACRPENKFLQQIGTTVTCAKPADLKKLAEDQQAKNRKAFNCFSNQASAECRTGWCSDSGTCKQSLASCPTNTRTDICPGGCGGCAVGYVYCPSGKPATPPDLMANSIAPYYPSNVPVCQLMDYSPDQGVQGEKYARSCAALGRGVANYCTGECTDCATGFTKSGRNGNACVPFAQRFIEILEDGLSVIGGPKLDGKYDYSAGSLATVFLRADEAAKADESSLSQALNWNSSQSPSSVKDLLAQDYNLCTSNIQCSSLRCSSGGLCYSPGKTSGTCVNNSDCELGYECNAQKQCAAWQKKPQLSGGGLWSKNGTSIYYNNLVGIGTNNPASNLQVVGSVAIGDANNQSPGAYSMTVGIGNVARGNASVAMGMNSLAEKDQSIALGLNSHSTEVNGIAIGTQAQVTGLSGIAIGQGAIASGKNSIAIGKSAKANGEESVAIGNNATVNGWQSLGIGLSGKAFDLQQHNSMAIMGGKVGIGTVTPVSTLHVAGNATIEDLKSCGSVYTDIRGQLQCGTGSSGTPIWNLNLTDAYRDIGYVGIGTNKPNTRLHIDGGLNATLSSPGYVQIGGVTAAILMDTNHIMARGNNAYSSLFLQKFGGNLGVGPKAEAPLHVSRGGDSSLTQNGYLLLGDTGGLNLTIDDNEIMARNNGAASDLLLQLDGGVIQIGRASSNESPKTLSAGEALQFGVRSNYSWLQSYNNKPLVLNPLGNDVYVGYTGSSNLSVSGQLTVDKSVKGAGFRDFVKKTYIYRRSVVYSSNKTGYAGCDGTDKVIGGGCSLRTSGSYTLMSSYPSYPIGSSGGSYSWYCDYDQAVSFTAYAICISPDDNNIRSSN